MKENSVYMQIILNRHPTVVPMKLYILYLLLLDYSASETGKSMCGSGHDFRSDQALGQSTALKEVCEHGSERSGASITHIEHLDTEGLCDIGVPLPTTQTFRAQVPNRIRYSSQQATELLVSTWNDLTSWTKRNTTSSVCELDVERSITGFVTNEMWALQMFDAWAKPGPSLLDGRSMFAGNYYQCRKTHSPTDNQRSEFGGNYCVVTLANLTNPINSTFYRLLALSKLLLGTCLPVTCSEEDVTGLFQERLRQLNLTSILLPLSADCQNEDREYTAFTKLAILIVVAIGILVLLGTTLDLITIYSPDWIKPMKDVYVNVLVSFSVYTNWQKLMDTSDGPGIVNVIPGIRFCTMIWILIGHIINNLVMYYASNAVEGVESVTNDRVSDIFCSNHFGVDSFFAISGLLVSHLKIKDVLDKGWRFNWSHFFLHRYCRLTAPLIVVLILVQGLQRFMVSGTVAPTVQPVDKLACERYWWSLPLYINNLYKTDLKDMCLSHTWSLAADMQFYTVSPLMLLPFYYHRYAGIFSCLVFVVGQWILAGYLSYQTNGGIAVVSWSQEWYNRCYYPPYTRIGPFAVGILFGYLLYAYNGRVQMRRSTIVTGWFLATTAVIGLIFGFHGDLSEESPSSLLVASMFNAVSHSVWGACVCWIIVACTSGYGGPVSAFLTWPPFKVLGRVTYIGYLIHISISTVFFENLEQHVNFNTTSVVTFGTVTLVFTCAVAAVLVMCVEFPILNLEKVFRDKNRHQAK